MSAATELVNTLVESVTEQTTLRAVFFNGETAEPEPWVLDMFSNAELDLPLAIEERDPATLHTSAHVPIPRCVAYVKATDHREHVAHYRVNPGPPVVVDGSRILDGNHRALADYMEKRPTRLIDVSTLPG